jgi:hypothetical protein
MVSAAHKLTIPLTRECRRYRKRDVPTQEQTETVVPSCTLQAGPPRAGSGAGEKLYCIGKLEGKRPLARDLRVDGILLLPLLIIISPRSRALLEKLIGPHLVKKFPWH